MQRSPSRADVPSVHPLEPRRLLDAIVEDGILIVAGTGGPDTIVVSVQGEGVAAVIRAVVGADVDEFPAADVVSVVVDAFGGDDAVTMIDTPPAVIRGDTGSDTITGGSADERIEGFDGADVLIGGPGLDRIFGGRGADVLSGGAGPDRLFGGPGGDTLRGHAGQDNLRGDGGPDRISGGSDGDVIDGGLQSDTVRGDGGNDGINAYDRSLLTLEPAADVLSGGGGEADQVSYAFVLRTGVTVTLDGVANDGEEGESDNVAADFESVEGSGLGDRIDSSGRGTRTTLNGAGGNDTLIGGSGADILRGVEGDDLLDGGSGEDRLAGNQGDDRLIADDGVADVLNGGAGADTATSDAGLDTTLNIEA